MNKKRAGLIAIIITVFAIVLGLCFLIFWGRDKQNERDEIQSVATAESTVGQTVESDGENQEADATQEQQPKYNNDQDFQELITYRYSSEEFSDIQEKLKSSKDISLFEIVDPKKIECIRNIEGIKYALLLSEKNEKLFIFFDADNVVTDTFYIEKDFLEKKDFINVQEGVTLMSDIETLDGSAVYYDISAVTVTGHIVKEGIVIIEYDRLLNRKILDDPVVKSIDFYSNDEILSLMESDYYVSTTPYILPKDKEFSDEIFYWGAEEYFNLLEGEWVAREYAGTIYEHGFDEAYEEWYQEEVQQHTNEIIEKYLGSEYRIEINNLVYFAPYDTLFPIMEDDEELLFVTRFIPGEFVTITPPYIGLSAQLADKNESYGFIIDADGTVLLEIKYRFFRLERR